MPALESPVAATAKPARARTSLLSMRDVCEILNLKRAAVRRLMREHGLRFVRVGRDLRFRQEWIDAFIDRDASTPAPRRRSKAR